MHCKILVDLAALTKSELALRLHSGHLVALGAVGDVGPKRRDVPVLWFSAYTDAWSRSAAADLSARVRALS